MLLALCPFLFICVNLFTLIDAVFYAYPRQRIITEKVEAVERVKGIERRQKEDLPLLARY